MTDERSVLISVVRGDLPPTAVEQLGVRLSGELGKRQLEAPASLPVVRVPLADLAYGVVAAWTRGGDASVLWAQVVLMLGNFELGESPEGEVLLEAVWDLSGGESLDEDALSTARVLAAQSA